MTPLAVVRERAPGERRVAVVPETVSRLAAAGLEVLVEAGAGAAARFPDDEYEQAGARVMPGYAFHPPPEADAGIVACLTPPDLPMYPGQTLVGLLDPLHRPHLVREWLAQGITAVSLDLLPRTLSRAQPMDALSSQASIAGYKAVLEAANAFGRFFPMLTTAAGTTAPARVLVLGAGVAGLSAIATARRLGGVVTAYDIRPQAREEVESLGARFLDLTAVTSGAGTGGYARALSDDEQRDLAAELAPQFGRFDVVITTAQVPGARPPLLVSTEALRQLAPGSVVVDLAASEWGGNVEGSPPDGTMVLDRGVTLIGAGNLPARVPTAASTAYARNLTALLSHLVHGGRLRFDPTDEIQAGVVVTHQGEVVNQQVAAILAAVEQEGAR